MVIRVEMQWSSWNEEEIPSKLSTFNVSSCCIPWSDIHCILYIVAILYYYFYKRTTEYLGDPRLYEDSSWLREVFARARQWILEWWKGGRPPCSNSRAANNTLAGRKLAVDNLQTIHWDRKRWLIRKTMECSGPERTCCSCRCCYTCWHAEDLCLHSTQLMVYFIVNIRYMPIGIVLYRL